MEKDFIRGIYLHDGFIFEPRERCPFFWVYEYWKKYLDWLASLGINAIEFCTQAAFLRKPSTETEFRRIEIMKRVIKYAHQKGMKVWYIVASNVLSKVPAGEEPIDQRDKDAYEEPCPMNPEARGKIIAAASYFFEQYEGIDAFELFAGDWGGCNCGKCDYTTYLGLARDYYNEIRKFNKTAEVYLNTWAVSYWQEYDKINPEWLKIFDDEARLSMKVAEALEDMPVDVGICLPFHHLYRPLAIAGRNAEQCPAWPDRQMVEKIHQQGRKVFAWPHFIMENDPIHIGRWGFMNARLSYLRALLEQLEPLDLDGIIGNLYNPQMQPLMAFAFAAMTKDSSISDEDILMKFASMLVAENDAGKLYNVLAFIENNDPWQADLPESWKTRHVECKKGWSDVMDIIKGITARADNPGVLQLCPSDCLKVIESTLEQLEKKPLTGSLS